MLWFWTKVVSFSLAAMVYFAVPVIYRWFRGPAAEAVERENGRLRTGAGALPADGSA